MNSLDNMIICPKCAKRGEYTGHLGELDNENAETKVLVCVRCGARYPINSGIVDLSGHTASRNISLSQKVMEFDPIVSIYERFFRRLVTTPFSDLDWEKETAIRLLNLVKGQTVLDVSCGPGNFTRLIADCVPEGTVGIDLSHPMLMRAVHRPDSDDKRISYLCADVTRWPFISDCFDRVLCAGSMHLYPELPSVFNSIERSLKPGGIFVGATYQAGGSPFVRLLQKAISTRSGFHWFDPGELKSLATGAGFIKWEEHILKQGIIFKVEKRH